MAQPEVAAAAEELYEALEPAFTDGDEDRGWPTLLLCAALTSGVPDQLHGYLTDNDDGTLGWAILLDPDNAPAEVLPYLAQFVGVVLAPEMTVEQQRAAIKAPEGFGRGRPLAIEAVARRRLTGSQTVLHDERYEDEAWRMRIRTLASETPDPAATEADIRREQKPIGIVLTYAAITTWDWADLQAAHATWADVIAAYDDWLEARTQLP